MVLCAVHLFPSAQALAGTTNWSHLAMNSIAKLVTSGAWKKDRWPAKQKKLSARLSADVSFSSFAGSSLSSLLSPRPSGDGKHEPGTIGGCRQARLRLNRPLARVSVVKGGDVVPGQMLPQAAGQGPTAASPPSAFVFRRAGWDLMFLPFSFPLISKEKEWKKYRSLTKNKYLETRFSLFSSFPNYSLLKRHL